ncbi:MAG TPA: outer membrane beta-barrel protein, partial [Spongiibacteraceae bacterium]
TTTNSQESNDMAMKKLSQAIGLAAMAMSGAVLADAPKLSEVLDASGIAITGYVDAAYIHYNNDVPSSINYFDDNKNTFDLKQAGITIASQPKEGFGAMVNLTGGSDADKIHSVGGSSSNLDVTQAIVQYATGPYTIIAGKFNTLAGAEVIAPTGNTNITRSIAFLNAIPFTHTGVRLAVAPADTLTLYAGLNNGWDEQKDVNSQKTVELGVAWAPVSAFSWTAQIYNGKEPSIVTGVEGNRFLFDTVITYKPIDALSLVLNYDYGKQKDAVFGDTDTKDAKWTAWIAYVNYQFTDQWHMSLRGEVFDDKDNYRLGLSDLGLGDDPSKKTKEVTLTIGYAPSANFEIRGEVRRDKSDKDAFVKTQNIADESETFTDKQTVVALEAYYKF